MIAAGGLARAAAFGNQPQRHREARRLRWSSVAAALLLHALFVTMLLLQSEGGRRNGGAPRVLRSMVITLAKPDEAPLRPPVQPTPPQAVEPPKEVLETAPDGQLPALTKPVPPRPRKPVTKSASAAAASSAASAAAAAAAAAAAPPAPSDTDSLLGRIHDNWLPPAGIPRSFRCLIRIDYRTGGFVTAVKYEQGCGGAMLDDSVERAIWKTQPLKIEAAQNGPGSILVEFTP